jgi:hypothetical protein
VVIVVQDVEAMVWAEKVKTETSSTITGDVAEVSKWRPMMEGRYPYMRKTTLDVKPSTIRSMHKEEDLTFAVFVNIPIGDDKTRKKDGKGVKTTAKEEPQWNLIVFRSDDPDNKNYFEILRGEPLCKLDLSNIYDGPFANDLHPTKADVQHTMMDDDADVEQEEPNEPSKVQYIVRLVRSGIDDTEEEEHYCGNSLTLTFCEKSDYKEDEDDDDGRETYSDDYNFGGDEDEDDDGDDHYEVSYFFDF